MLNILRIRGVIKFIILSLFLPVTNAKRFMVHLQSSEKWSKNEWMEYKGHIPELTEFTVCHWENLRYFSSSETTVWSYCGIISKKSTPFRCIGIYSSGVRASANRKVKFGVWLEGWTKSAIADILEVKDYRHRNWNHVCWSYSSVSSANKLYFNGDLVGHLSMYLENRSMITTPVHDSINSYKSAFIVGQDQDIIKGGYNSAESYYGEISELNMWSPMLANSKISSMAECMNIEQGNVISWTRNLWNINIATVKELGDTRIFCDDIKSHIVIFPEPQTFKYANHMCQIHGGSLIVPHSDDKNGNIMDLLVEHKSKCMNKELTDTLNEGKAAWLGLQRIGYEWYDMTNSSLLTSSSYSNWIQNGVQVDRGCAYLHTDGSWGAAYSQSFCNMLQLCSICSIPETPVFTMKGLCEKGTPFDWNYYMFINSSSQLEYYDGFKKNSKILFDGAKWRAVTRGSRISVRLSRTPVGRLEWNWYENSCGSKESQKKELTFSQCKFGDEFTCNTGHCILLEKRCNGVKHCDDGSDEENCNFVIIPKSYRKVKPPKSGTRILTRLEILSIDTIDSINMRVGLTIELSMKWCDNRLRFRNLVLGQTNLLNTKTVENLWLPLHNLLYENAIIGKTLEDKYNEVALITAQNVTKSIESMSPYRSLEDVWYKGGNHLLQVTQRLKIDFVCSFYLVHFPFDRQKCDFILNMKNTKHSNVYFSKDESTVVYKGPKKVHSFEIQIIPSHTLHRRQLKNTTNWDNLFIFSMQLERNYQDHVIIMFFPELLLWCVAYITIFLRITDISNRSRISVTILLALVSLIGAIQGRIPKTPYFKYIDIWSIWYLSNIFLITCFHVLMECFFKTENIESNLIYTFESKIDLSLDLMEDEKKKIKSRVRINKCAAFFFPIVTTIFNICYFSLSFVNLHTK